MRGPRASGIHTPRGGGGRNSGAGRMGFGLRRAIVALET